MSKRGRPGIDSWIIRLSSLGDIVQALALLGPLRSSGHEVGWICEARFARVFDFLVPDLRVPCVAWDRTSSSLGRLAQHIRDFGGQPRCTIDIQGNLKSGLVARAVKAPCRYALARRDLREKFAALFRATRAEPARGPHVLDRGLAAVEVATGRTWVRTELSESPLLENGSSALDASVRERVQEGTIVIVLQDPADPRSLPIELIEALSKRFANRGVLAIAGPRESAVSWPLAWEVVRQRGDVGELIALGTLVRERDAVVFGPDCGATHVLRMTGARTLFAFGPQDHARTGPLPEMPGAAVVTRRANDALACQPCLAKRCHLPEGPRCMREIRVDDVAYALDALTVI